MIPFLNLHALAVIFIVVACIPNAFVFASSSPPRPIRRIDHPVTHALEILPRTPTSRSIDVRALTAPPLPRTTLRHSDSLRLTLSAFGQTYRLHLRPNDHLIHPSARIAYYTNTESGDSVISHTEPLLRENVKAYYGDVVPEHASSERMRVDAARVKMGSPGPQGEGWARIMVHHQGSVEDGMAPVFEGAFSVGGVIHHVVTKDNYLRNKHELDPGIMVDYEDMESPLVIWRESDVMSAGEVEEVMRGGRVKVVQEGAVSCGHDSLKWNTDPSVNPALRIPPPVSLWEPFGMDLFHKRDDVAGNSSSSNFASTIGSTAGCPTSQKIIYMGVAADCEYTATYGSQSNATQQILTDWNTASALYKSTFNISLGILEVQIQNSTCPTTANASVPWNVDCNTVDLNSRLSLFSQWRGEKGEDGTGLWHLMSGCPTGTEVGIAWLSTLCQTSSSGSGDSIVSGTAVSTAGRTEWQVVSHEIGHNFGAIHDCISGCNETSSCCPLTTSTCDSSSQFIMSPTASTGEMQFSQCSIGNICTMIQGTTSAGKLNDTCLVSPNPSLVTLSLQMCGNGIVEEGEDCDPGSGVNSTCCDVSTCKFTSGSVCDPGSSACCTDTCGFAPQGQVCRAALNATCDTAEVCTGSSASCPADVTIKDGTSCGSGLACASGQCTSLSQQCQNLGSSMNLVDACPEQDDKSCQVSCQDPSNSGKCVVLDTMLIDGSPCGYGGMCYNGTCQSKGVVASVESWYGQNLQIAIPVTVVGGLVVILLIVSVFFCIKRRAITKRIGRAPTTPGLANQSGRRLPSIDGIVNVAGAGGVAAVSRTGSGSSRSRPGQQINRSDSGASSYSQNSMRSVPTGPRVIAVGGPESASLAALSSRSQGGMGPQLKAARGLGGGPAMRSITPTPTVNRSGSGHSRSSAGSGGSGGSGSSGSGRAVLQRNRSHWVDEALWNGR